MRADREPLCPRCGSAIYERVSETESRCSECGLGRTSVPLHVEHHERSRVGATSHEDEADVFVEVRQRMTGAFADASFSPCGLDARWKGTRWFGGSGSSDGVVTSLELAHGEDPWDEASTQVRVEVRLPRRVFDDDEANVEIERADLAREHVSRFWMATGTLDPDVRAAAFPTEAVQGEWMAPWADAEIAIDGTSVAFRRLGDDGYWLAQAPHGRLLVGIESRGWPVESTGLVTMEDLAPYIEGSDLIAARGRRRFG
jgi:ribosomal protein L37E